MAQDVVAGAAFTRSARDHPPRARVRRRVRVPWREGASLAVGAVLWEVVGRSVDATFFPPLSAVLVRLVELVVGGDILTNLAGSLANFAIAFAFCIVVGVPVGMLMGLSPRLHSALDIYVNAFLTAPSLIFAPIFFAVFGLSRWSIVAVIVMYALFIIVVSSESAVRNVDPAIVEMARAFNANRVQRFFAVILPAALPMVLAGLRLGAGRGVKGMINGEMFIAAVGLSAGPDAVKLIAQYGIQLPVLGLLVSGIPALISLMVGSRLMKIEAPILLGAIAGQHCSTPTITALVSQSQSSIPVIGYTVTYAISNVLLPLMGPVVVGVAMALQ